VVGILTLLAGLSILLYYDRRMHVIARLLLALGMAIQAGRLSERHLARWTGTLPRLAGGSALLLMLTATTCIGGRWLRERMADSTLVPAPTGAPNVLLIILDTVRAMEASLYGYESRTTPVLTRVGRTGVVFDMAVSAAPWTVPSHATLFTGRLGWGHKADWYSRLDPSVPTLARAFGNRGYRTAGFSANVVYAGWEFGFARDFMHFEDHGLSATELVANTTLGHHLIENIRVRRLLDFWDLPGRPSAEDITANALHWLSKSGDRPYFAFLNYFDAHRPRIPPESFARHFGAPVDSASLASRIRGFVYPSQKPHRSRSAYDAAIAYVDSSIGTLLDGLDRAGLLENTLVIITADHGELLGEHELWGHANGLYFPTLHVPLLVTMPGSIPAARRIAEPVTLRDVPATILDLAGIRPRHAFPGRSLARYWKAAPSPRQPPMPTPIISAISGLPKLGTDVPVGRGDMVSLVQDSLHYIRYGDGVEEIYDIRRDEVELSPLGVEARASESAMRRRVDSTLEAAHHPLNR